MADVPGGYQPDTRSESSRRADFDLRRRISKYGGGGGANVATQPRLVAVGSTTSPTISTATWGNATNGMTFTTRSGHYYKIVMAHRAVVSSSGTHIRTRLSTNTGVPVGDSYIDISASGLTKVYMEWLIAGDGASHTFIGMYEAPSDQPLTVYGEPSADCYFYAFDLGTVQGA